MSRAVWAHSIATRVVSAMTVGDLVSTRDLAERLGLSHAQVSDALTTRSRGVKDVVRMPKGWIRTEEILPREPSVDSCSPRVAREAGIRQRATRNRKPEIVQPRTPAPFREWQPAAQARPVRLGSLDYQRVPSRYGEHRVEYRGLNSISPTTRDCTISGLK
jgi:hypothetical protein